MLSTDQSNSNPLHRLTRFVTEQAAAMMFNLEADEIYVVERWGAHRVCPRQRRESVC